MPVAVTRRAVLKPVEVVDRDWFNESMRTSDYSFDPRGPNEDESKTRAVFTYTPLRVSYIRA